MKDLIIAIIILILMFLGAKVISAMVSFTIANPIILIPMTIVIIVLVCRI